MKVDEKFPRIEYGGDGVMKLAMKFIVDLWAKAGRPLDVEMLVNDGVDMFISSYKRISNPGCHKEV